MILSSVKKRLKSIGKGEFADDAALWMAAGDDVIALHDRDGRFAKVSAGAEALFGVPAQELVGRRLMSVVAPAHQHRLLSALAQLADLKNEGQARFQCRLRCGETLGAAVEISLIPTPGGLTSLTRAIDAEIEAAAALKSREAALEAETSRRAQHFANVSHEIKTPLNAVIGFADAISQERFGPMGNDRYREYAGVIQESGQHLLALITDVLDLSKAEADEVVLAETSCHLPTLIRRCVDIVRLQADEAGLSLDVDIATDVGEAVVDPKVLRQILLNLLSNALKFTAEGGVRVAAWRGGPNLVVEVTDTGIGMSPDDLSRVGQRYKQARAEGVRGTKGSGIGLALSKALARVHGGQLRLMSEEGCGTTAVLHLPYREVRSPQDNPEGTNITHLSDKRRA